MVIIMVDEGAIYLPIGSEDYYLACSVLQGQFVQYFLAFENVCIQFLRTGYVLSMKFLMNFHSSPCDVLLSFLFSSCIQLCFTA